MFGIKDIYVTFEKIKEQLAKANCSSPRGMEKYNHVTYSIDRTLSFNQPFIKGEIKYL